MKRYKNKEWLTEQYSIQNKTQSEISDMCDVGQDTISYWVRKFGIKKPWRQEELLREYYSNQGFSSHELGDMWDCDKKTVLNALEEFGIEKHKSCREQNLSLRDCFNGYEKFGATEGEVFHHRLLAVTEFGFDSVSDSVVHHQNRIPWDNRSENLKLFESQSEHRKHHIRIERETKFLKQTLGA